jgi:hypothetical protein
MSELTKAVKQLLAEVTELKSKKDDTNNLKSSYQKFVVDYNANTTKQQVQIDALRDTVASMQVELNKLDCSSCWG